MTPVSPVFVTSVDCVLITRPHPAQSTAHQPVRRPSGRRSSREGALFSIACPPAGRPSTPSPSYPISVLSKAAEDRYQGSIQGFGSSLESVASILGLILGGIWYGTLETGVFVLSAVIIFIVSFMSMRLLLLSKGIAQIPVR